MINLKVLKKLYKKQNIFDVHISNQSFNPKQIVINEISDSKFCPQSIKDYLIKSNKYFNISSNHNIKFHIFHDTKTAPNMFILLKAYKQAVVIKQYFNIQTSFEVFIIMAPDKRYICEHEIIGAKHINGGFTSHNDNKIFITRSQEFAKVILHEILHHVSQIDNKYKWNNYHVQKLKEAFNISSNTVLLPNEAIVELWATIFYCIFLSFNYHIPYKHILKKEIDFSIKQYNKIITKQGNKAWYEHTNAYCYIVFKTILLLNLNKYSIIRNDMDKIVSLLIEFKNTIPITKTNDKSLRMMTLSDY